MQGRPFSTASRSGNAGDHIRQNESQFVQYQYPNDHAIISDQHQHQHDAQSFTKNQLCSHPDDKTQNIRQREQYSHPFPPINDLFPSSKPIQPPHPGVAIMSNNFPTVDSATDEIWRCDTDDFRSASHAIHMLRLAIVAEWESQRRIHQENVGFNDNLSGRNDLRSTTSRETNGNNGENAASMTFSYDPSETFLSLQGAALRFHARFHSMWTERNAKLAAQKQASHAGEYATLEESDSLEWELTEQGAWEVWEESVRASAALAHACVGPAWHRQIAIRRKIMSEGERRWLNYSHLRHQSSITEGSNVELVSSSSNLSLDFSNPQSSGRLMPGQPMTVLQTVATDDRPVVDVVSSLRFHIPEVLPAAMIRFAASAGDTSVPSLRSGKTKIIWSTDNTGIASGENEQLLITLGRHIHDERRWLRRRKRLGDAQR